MSKSIIAGFIAIAFISVGVVFTLQSSKQATTSLQTINLGVESSLLSAAVWIAEKKGYYLEQGLEVKITTFSTGRDSLLAMLDKKNIDISTVAPTPIMFASFERSDFSILATFAYSYDNVKIIAHKDSGISNANNLKGKTIATPFGTTGQFFLASYLELAELSASDVNLVDIKPTDLATALIDKQVDAIVIWEPHAYHAKQLLQDDAIQVPASDMYRETFNFMVMNDFAQSHSASLEGFLKANLKATSFINNNKKEAQQIISQRLKLDIAVVTNLWDQFHFNIMLDQSLLTTLEDEARWALKNALTQQTTMPDYLNYLAPQPLKSVNPIAVSVIHETRAVDED